MKLDLVLRSLTALTAAILAGVGLALLIQRLFVSFHPRFALISLYVTLGAILCVVGESNVRSILVWFPFLQGRTQLGFAVFFVGTLTFAVSDFESALDITAMVLGIVLTCLGVVHVAFGYFEAKLVERGLVDPDLHWESVGGGSSGGSGGGSTSKDDYYSMDSTGGADIYGNVASSYQGGLEGGTDYMHDRVSKAAANAARDTENQKRAGQYVAGAAQDRETQAAMGERLAGTTDNQYLQQAARSETFQSFAGSAVSSLATNEAIQRAAGEQLASAAEDKEMQKKMAGAMADGARTAGQGAWDAADAYYA